MADVLQGTIVFTRWRYREYKDEPYDIINHGQEFGYENAKERPVVILGEGKKGVIVAPLGTLHRPDGELKWNARESINRKEAYVPEDFAEDYAQVGPRNHHRNGTFVDLGDVKEIPFGEFSFREFVDGKTHKFPEKTVKEMIEFTGQHILPVLKPLHPVPVWQNPHIHPEDPECLCIMKRREIKHTRKGKKQDELMEEYQSLSQNRISTISKTDTELIEHRQARKLGLSRPEMEARKFAEGMAELSSAEEEIAHEV